MSAAILVISATILASENGDSDRKCLEGAEEKMRHVKYVARRFSATYLSTLEHTTLAINSLTHVTAVMSHVMKHTVAGTPGS